MPGSRIGNVFLLTLNMLSLRTLHVLMLLMMIYGCDIENWVILASILWVNYSTMMLQEFSLGISMINIKFTLYIMRTTTQIPNAILGFN